MRDLVSMFKGHYGKFGHVPDSELLGFSCQSRCRSKSIPWADAQAADTYSSAACYDAVRDPIWLDGKPGDLVHLSTESRGGGLNEIPD